MGGVFLIVLNPAVFGAAELYAGLVARTLTEVKEVRPRPGFDEVHYAGELEARSQT